MVTNDEIRRPFVSKLAALTLVILGFLVAAAGYRYGHAWYIGGGIVLLALGFIILARKVINRNQRY